MGETRERSTPGRSRRIVGRGVIPAGEVVVFDTRPSLWMIVLRSVGPGLMVVAGFLVVSQLGVLLQPWVAPSGGMTWLSPKAAFMAGLVVLSAVLLWQVLSYAARRYVLTESRAILVFGVLEQHVSEIPLSRVQNVSISKPLALRVLGLGHVGLASAGTDGFEVVWRYVRKPEALVGKVREHAGRRERSV